MDKEWHSDKELFSLIRTELYTAVVGDICDQMGFRNQFLPPDLHPLDKNKKNVLAGRAMTALEEDISTPIDETTPWGKMLEALDNLRDGDVYICSGSVAPYALFGELMSTAALKRGAVGAICNGFVRDTHQIVALEFPVYCRGSYALDQRGRGTVRDYRVPLLLGDVWINPGDLLIGDVDGLIVVPFKHEAEVIVKSLAKVRTESIVRTQLAKGMFASEAFARYGVL
ncbi:MAG TPA: RraA family protein [Acidobacteriaceae bacterium]|nr:RraA family protein [Acidobacteriaceae bacterium]